MPLHTARRQDPAAPTTISTSQAEAPMRGLGRGLALALILVVATLYAVSHMDQGTDTWISLAGGRDVVTHGVRTTDPFSFNSRPGTVSDSAQSGSLWSWLHPSGWINQNWLTHVVLFEVQRVGGLDALVAWKLLVYLLVAVTMAVAARTGGAGAISSVSAAAAALAVGRDYLSMRGQDVTNLLAAVLLLVLALARHRDSRWVWALPPLFAVWGNAHGGFVYGLALLAIAITGAALPVKTGAAGNRASRVKGLALASLAAVSATVVLSPYRLANLTHPLVISVSSDAPLWRVVHEWRPILSNPLSSPIPFLLFAGITLTAAVMCELNASRYVRRYVDAPGAVMVFGSFALALSSARFVPLACVTAAPFLAVWLDGAAFLAAGWVSHPARRTRAPRIVTDATVWLVAVVAAVAFAVRAGRTYFGPWPQDAARTSAFDRMTHSHQRPWGPCSFLAANGITGRMWNFWDEGGFLAFCQQPEPARGTLPVGIFIDGRAQAAYDPQALRSYLDLLNGPGRSGQAGESLATVADLDSLRAWTARRLHELDVSLALIPAGQQRTAFARAAASMPGWQLVYIDAEHTLFVDTGSAGGRALAERVASGAAHYPDEASAKLTAAFRLLPPRTEEDQRRAVELAVLSYHAAPSSLAVLCATRAAHTPAAGLEALRFCRGVAEEFTSNRDRYREGAGYSVRLEAATLALEYLATVAKSTDQAELLRWAGVRLSNCREEQDEIATTVIW
jgi:hypothetical protein